MTPIRPPKDGIRAMPPGSLTDAGDGRTLIGRLSPANEWTEINSVREGHFMERHAPGAFAKTFAENRDRIRILFQHGKDPQLGNKPIAAPQEFGEDEVSPFYRGEILDGLDPLILDGLKRGLYGSSHTFEVVREDWDPKPKGGAHNPRNLPERTIREVKVWEMGPVTWPAYAGATAQARSMSDEFLAADLADDPDRLRDLASYIDPPAPSVDAGAEPHLEPERRDEDPPPEAAPAIPQDPPEGGSSDSRSAPVEYITREEKVSRVAELKASLTALANEHPGVLPEEAQAEWDAQTKEMDALERDIAAWDERQALLGRYKDDETKTERAVAAPAVHIRQPDENIYDVPALLRSARTNDERDQKLRDAALRAVETTRFIGPGANDQADIRANVSQLVDYGDSEDKEVARLILNTGSPQYRRAFNRYVASGGSERAAALAVGVDGTGGYSVPVAFDPTIIGIGAHTTVNPYRTACRVVNITGTDTWQALTSTAVVSAYALEAAAATEQGPTFARPEFIVKRAHSFITASYEMAQDRPDLPAELAVLFAESKDNLEETQFTTGVGTTVYPQGMFLDGAFTAVETIGNNVVAIADIYALEAALPIRHRANAAWFMNRSVIHTVAGFETATGHLFNGAQYQSVGPVAQNPGGNTGLRLLGYPVWEVPSASAAITTSAAIVAVFADPRNYVIVDRVGMSVKVIPDMLNGATPSFPTGEIGIYAFWRNTARVLNADGGRQLKVNAP